MPLTTSIDKPGLVLPQRHDLWTSSYHLIHPVDGSDSLDYNTNGEAESYDIAIWAQPNNPIDLRDETGRSVGLHVGRGFHYVGAGTQAELGCYYPCSANDNCQDPLDPNDDTVCATCDYGHYYPTLLTARIKQSTFNNHLDYWGMATGQIKGGRTKILENRLITGDCVIDDDTSEKVNPYLSGNPDDTRVEILNGGVATSLSYAIGLLDEALADCNGAAAGMIHAPIPVASFWSGAGFLRSDDVDYGDGMGEREILRTKTRGNIVVAGAGYADALGPEGAVAADGTAWVYTTSMVYLVWDKIRVSPGPGQIGQATSFGTNDVHVSAEQLVGAFFDTGCNHAILVDLTAEI